MMMKRSFSGRSCAFETEKLPWDLIIEVLFRLPVKTLLRFRCVSKQWFAFITCSSFKLTYDDYIKKKKKRSEDFSSFLLLWDRVKELDTMKQFIRLRVIDLTMEKNSNGVRQFYSEFKFSSLCHKRFFSTTTTISRSDLNRA